VRKLKKGSGKYKGKFPFKCFNCGKVGHFAAKCPYVKNESSDDEEDHNIKKGRKHHQYKKNKHEKKKNTYKKKKSLYSKGVSDSSEESDESIFDSDREETLFMEMETKGRFDTHFWKMNTKLHL
jgi:hypothetical protein